MALLPPEASHHAALTGGPRWQPLLLRAVGHILQEEAELLARWRARLTAAFLLAVVSLGTIPMVPSVAFALRERIWTVVGVDLGLFAISCWLLFSRRVTNQARALFLVIGCFLVGANAVIGFGPGSGVLGWLFMSVFLAAFLLGPRASFVTVVATLLLMGGVATAITNEWVPWATELPNALNRWKLTALNFTFLITVFSFTNVLIMRLLETEERARARAVAELAEARHHEALGTLAGGIAHDFNNLLVPVLANLELVHDRLAPASEDRAVLREAQHSAQRARELVQRILRFGRGVEEERRAHSVTEALRDALAFARASAPPHVTFVVETTPVPPVRAADAELHQVLVNLLTNAVHAVEASAADARVHVHIEPHVVQEVPCVRIVVRDTGPGMDARTQERIFDPYFSTKAPERGTGLGLPIVRSIVRSLGGTIRVRSAPGQGTTFVVDLPAAAVVADTRASIAAAPEAGAIAPLDALAADASASHTTARPLVPVRVLLVDDEPTVRRATARLLQHVGFEVHDFAQPREALALLERAPHTIDVLLTDYRMPNASGLELARAARAITPMLPIVLASGHLEEALAEQQGVPGLTLLAKPFSRAELERAVREAMASTTVTLLS